MCLIAERQNFLVPLPIRLIDSACSEVDFEQIAVSDLPADNLT